MLVAEDRLAVAPNKRVPPEKSGAAHFEVPTNQMLSNGGPLQTKHGPAIGVASAEAEPRDDELLERGLALFLPSIFSFDRSSRLRSVARLVFNMTMNAMTGCHKQSTIAANSSCVWLDGCMLFH
jgi:hypothetical protein